MFLTLYSDNYLCMSRKPINIFMGYLSRLKSSLDKIRSQCRKDIPCFFLFVQPLTVKIQRKARECRPNYNIIVIPCLFLLAPPPSVRVNIYICIIVGLGWHQRCKTLPGICILGLALVGNDAVKQSLRELDNQGTVFIVAFFLRSPGWLSSLIISCAVENPNSAQGE